MNSFSRICRATSNGQATKVLKINTGSTATVHALQNISNLSFMIHSKDSFHVNKTLVRRFSDLSSDKNDSTSHLVVSILGPPNAGIVVYQNQTLDDYTFHHLNLLLFSRQEKVPCSIDYFVSNQTELIDFRVRKSYGVRKEVGCVHFMHMSHCEYIFSSFPCALMFDFVLILGLTQLLRTGTNRL